MNQPHFDGKSNSRRHSTMGFYRECRSDWGANKLTKVRSFIILRLGENFTSLNENNRALRSVYSPSSTKISTGYFQVGTVEMV